MNNTKMHTLGLTILVCLLVERGLACETMETRKCQDFELISRNEFVVFIQEKLLDETCSRIRNALACAYTDGRLDQCPFRVKAPFEFQRGVNQAICGGKKEDYLKSAQCFNKEKLKSRISELCLSKLKSLGNQPCGLLTEIAECARDQILTTDGCHYNDGILMKDLVEIYLRPLTDEFRCFSTNGTSGKLTDGRREDVMKNNGFSTKSMRRGQPQAEQNFYKKIIIGEEITPRTSSQRNAKRNPGQSLKTTLAISRSPDNQEVETTTKDIVASEEKYESEESKFTNPHNAESIKPVVSEEIDFPKTMSTIQIPGVTYIHSTATERSKTISSDKMQDFYGAIDSKMSVPTTSEREVATKLNNLKQTPRASQSTQGASAAESGVDLIALFVFLSYLTFC